MWRHHCYLGSSQLNAWHCVPPWGIMLYTATGIYTPHSENANVYVNELEYFFLCLPSASFLCLSGDVNVNTLSPARPIGCDYLNALFKSGFLATISSCTREEYFGTKLVTSSIDNINCRAPFLRIDSAVIKHTLADHYFRAATFICSFLKWHHSNSFRYQAFTYSNCIVQFVILTGIHSWQGKLHKVFIINLLVLLIHLNAGREKRYNVKKAVVTCLGLPLPVQNYKRERQTFGEV